MVSNGLSARRGPLRRPKVCKASPNPGRCHPKLNCTIVPDEFTIFQMSDQDLVLTHCNEALPYRQGVNVILSAELGSFVNFGLERNCVVDDAKYFPDLVGTYVLTMKVEFSDQKTCKVEAIAHVIPNPP